MCVCALKRSERERGTALERGRAEADSLQIWRISRVSSSQEVRVQALIQEITQTDTSRLCGWMIGAAAAGCGLFV